MITEDYVSFETAKLLHACGFWSDECVALYDCGNYNEFVRDDAIFQNGAEDYLESEHGEEWSRFGYYLAPTIQMAMKWLRKVHKIHIMADCIGSENYISTIQFTHNSQDIMIEGKKSKIGGNGFDSYEEACEAAIKYCLENLI